MNSKVTVSGDVHLILKKGCTLTATEGIYVQEGSSLTIYGQPDGDGKLIVTGDSGQAGIGGFNANIQDNAPITITIHGGNIQATGGGGGAGIGCAGALPSSITIYGGTIEATGGTNSAGIGGGVEAVRPIINIYGGSITATGGQNGAGIGGGFDKNPVAPAKQPSTINIYGGTITATGGKHENVGYSDKPQRYAAGIGGGDNSLYYTVNIYGGNITASRYAYHNGYGIRGQITLNAIESLNGVIRSRMKTKLKLVWIAVSNASKKWTMPISNWSKALSHFYVRYADRFPKVA